jgi:hypothetical protein
MLARAHSIQPSRGSSDLFRIMAWNAAIIPRASPSDGLAPGARHRRPGRLILAAISAVFTIGYVAKMLGEDEEWLWDLSTDMFSEDGCLRVYGVGEDGVPAFTQFGIERLQETIRELRAAGEAPSAISTE